MFKRLLIVQIALLAPGTGLLTLVRGIRESLTYLSSSVAIPRNIRMFVSACCSRKRARGKSKRSFQDSSVMKSL